MMISLIYWNEATLSHIDIFIEASNQTVRQKNAKKAKLRRNLTRQTIVQRLPGSQAQVPIYLENRAHSDDTD